MRFTDGVFAMRVSWLECVIWIVCLHGNHFAPITGDCNVQREGFVMKNRIYTILTGLFIAICFLSALSGVSADTLVVPVPEQVFSVSRDGDFQRLSVEGYGYLNHPGAPELPSRIYAVALPPGTTLETLEIRTGPAIAVPGRFNIQPVDIPRVITGKNPVHYARDFTAFQKTYETVYHTDSWYPAELFGLEGSAHLRRYNLINVRVTPFQYNPVSGELKYYPSPVIEITTRQGDVDETLLSDLAPGIENRACDFILNYRECREWYGEGNGSRGLHDFVIITTADLVNAVNDLVIYETTKGRTVEVVTVDWIDVNYSGVDLAQKMRNFLREKYPSAQWGIEDVLLVGHHSDVPMRLTDQDLGYGKPRTDFYFAELSEPDNVNWDHDGDGNYWEDADSADYYSEINVGRIPWSDYSTVQNICQKSISYEMNDDPGFKKNILLLGGYFWDDTDNAVLMEAKVDQEWMSDWTMTRMYEQNADYYSSYACDYELNHTNVMNQWSNGTYAFVNWAGHGTETSSHIYGIGAPAFITSSDCNSLNDSYPAIIFADACSNSDTDYVNIGAAMLKRGGVGFVGATKVALGEPGWTGPMSGSSQSLDYYFTTGVTSGDYSQGASIQRALLTVYQNSGWSYNKYEIAEWNLWGNPDLGMAPVISGDGAIFLDKSMYAPGSEILVSVRDMDLNLSPTTLDSVDVTVITSSGDTETLVLTETEVSSGVLDNTILLVTGSVIPQNGVLETGGSGTLTGIYIDADDGHGGFNVEKSAEATIDGVPPVISQLEISGISDDGFTVSWSTDEFADSYLVYGTVSPDTRLGSDVMVQNHEVSITGLDPCTFYVFYVESTDEAGNTAIEDNSGSFYNQQTYQMFTIQTTDMNTDPGWDISGGLWAWGSPTGSGGDHGYPDPSSGFTGSSVYGYNLSGDYTNNMPERHLTTTAIDCSAYDNVKLSFRRWLGVERSIYDHASVRVSSNGSNWQTIWSNPDVELSDNAWSLQEFDITDPAAGSSTVYIRWTMGDSDGGWVYCGWNIDDVMILSSEPCGGPTPTPRPTYTPAPATPTGTPAPTFTPTAAPATPTPGVFYVDLELNKTTFTGGDDFLLTCRSYNPGSEITLDQYILLDAVGQYFFWPDWTVSPACRLTTVPQGTSPSETILSFTWPEGNMGQISGLHFWAAFLDPSTNTLVGELDFVEFGYE